MTLIPLCFSPQGVLKKGDAFPVEIAKAQLRESFLSRMLPQTRLTRGSQQAVKKGALQPVHISVEKRQGNKVRFNDQSISDSGYTYNSMHVGYVNSTDSDVLRQCPLNKKGSGFHLGRAVHMSSVYWQWPYVAIMNGRDAHGLCMSIFCSIYFTRWRCISDKIRTLRYLTAESDTHRRNRDLPFGRGSAGRRAGEAFCLRCARNSPARRQSKWYLRDCNAR